MSNKATPTKRKAPAKRSGGRSGRGRKANAAEAPEETIVEDEDGGEDLEDSADAGEDEDVEIEESDDLDVDDDEDGELRAVEEELSQKDQNARSLAIRRAIEARMEQKRLDEDLDYLDLDLED